MSASEFPHVSTVEELAGLDADAIMSGYWSGIEGEPAPGSDKCPSFSHGWRNGRVDGGYATPSAAQIALLTEMATLRAMESN